MNLHSLIERFKDQKVVVLGDLIADVFVHGDISRVSREAPVLILSHRRTELIPGGAANAVENIWALGAKAVPVGIIGDDAEGRQLVEQFEAQGIDTSGIRTVRSYSTPTKTRVLAGAAHAYPNQVLRIDRGDGVGRADLEKVQKKIRIALGARIKKAHALLISDYGYGAVEPSQQEDFRPKGLPVTIDSRFRVDQYRGLTAATPNEPEVEAALGLTINNDLTSLEKAGRKLLRKLKHNALLITRGRNGMALFEPGKKTVHIPIHGPDEVADVTGAGDTVIAVFTLALASGGSFAEAAVLANIAGGIAVMKHGTQPVTYAELAEAVASVESR
jgi:rfaE bifunctional protein kinase chain/domain